MQTVFLSKILNRFSTAFAVVLFSFPFTEAHAAQVDISGPTGSVAFGSQVVVLPNGNIIVTDPGFSEGGLTNIGAVYLYDGATLALISTLKGTTTEDRIGAGAITVLPSGNFVIPNGIWDNGVAANAGALTFCNGVTGCDGVVSASNSLIGTTAGDLIGGTNVIVLPNGNYLARSVDWDKTVAPIRTNVGVVTHCSGTSGCTGTINASNSLIGSETDDRIGSLGITVLTDGDYVVNSQLWNAGAISDVGAITFCSGTTGCAGVVSAANSLVGERNSERIGTSQGAPGSNGVIALANGNDVVASGLYNPSTSNPNPVGAVTFCSGAGGCAGTVLSNTSLTGSTNAQSVGINGVTALPNGNYVVNSPLWDNGIATDVGAVTFCSGTIGCGTTVNTSNSLVGSTSFDSVGNVLTLPNLVNPVTVLSDGNYVIVSPAWDNGPTADVGAITWCSGTTGCVGGVSPANSIIGSTTTDRLGSFGFVRGVYALKNGNYVVNSPFWNDPSLGLADAGAVTFCNGAANSCANTVVSSANSLTGSKASDFLGIDGTTVLTNGNYVTASRNWDNGAGVNFGAISFCGGATGCSGPVNAANSLIGSRADDFLNSIVTILPNGNYVVASPNRDDGLTANVGSISFCSGTSGCTGTISPLNSLVGLTANDQLGSFGVTVLISGNYAVSSPSWDNGGIADAGAMTFCNGATGCTGTVSISNSLTGTTASDQVGNLTKLLSGNYVVQSANWDNVAATNAGAVTFGDGTSGTIGAITSANSVLGTVANGGFMSFSYDAVRNRLCAGRRASNTVSILFFETTAVADGNLNDPSTWSGVVPNALTSVVIPAGRTVTVNVNTTIGSLSVANGGNLIMSANLALTGDLTLGTQINTGTNTLALSCSSNVVGASASNYIIGTLEKNFCSAGSFSYPTGTASGYSPVEVTVTAMDVNPSSLTIKANQGNRTGMDSGQSAQRFWTLTETGGLTANLSFNYLDGDVAGDESTYKLYRWNGTTPTLIPSVLNAGSNTIAANGISAFSDWTVGNLAPTAANVTVSGRVSTPVGRGLMNAVVSMTNQHGTTRIARTNTFGYFRFHEIETGQTYIVSVAGKRYRFTSRIVPVTDEIADLDLIAEP